MFSSQVKQLASEFQDVAKKACQFTLTKYEVKSFLINLMKVSIVSAIMTILYMSQFLWILCLVGFISTTAILLCFTSILWVPLALIWGPIIVITALLCNKTAFGKLVLDSVSWIFTQVIPLHYQSFILYEGAS
jgi:hypothetical protein